MTIGEIMLFFLVGALILFMNIRFFYVKSKYVKVHAVCVSVKHGSDEDNFDTFHPTWQYDYNGTTYSTYDRGNYHNRIKMGEETEIYICPKKPQKIYTESAVSIVTYDIIILIMILIGAFFIFL